MLKALVGKQHNLPEELKAKIEASPTKKKCNCGGECPKCKPSMARNYKKGYYGA